MHGLALPGVLSQLRENASAGVKAGIREAVERLLPQLLASLGDAAPPDVEELELAEKLQVGAKQDSAAPSRIHGLSGIPATALCSGRLRGLSWLSSA